MGTQLWRAFGVITFVCFIGGVWTAAQADEPAVAMKPATVELVREALQREAYGLSAERAALLRTAVQDDADAPQPHWYLGEVRSADGGWEQAGKVLDPRAGQLVREYRILRDTKADDAQGQKSLADWCASKGLNQQARAHWLRSLSFNPQQNEIRKRLGLIKIGQQWYEPAALEQQHQRARKLSDATVYWQPIFTRLGLQLSSKTDAKRAAALAEIEAVKDPLALPALQATIGARGGEDEQELVIRACTRHEDVLATEMLAWYAVEALSPRLRNIATKELAKRELSDFAPLLISEMFSAVTVQVDVVRTFGGNIGLRRSFVREAADHHQWVVSDTLIRPGTTLVASGVLPANPETQRLYAAERAIHNTQVDVERQNHITARRNERISEALTLITGQQLGPQPEPWWQWWMDLNEWTLPSGKGLARYYESFSVSDPLFIRPIRISCLIAGTPITTDQGLVAVETLKAGDLVLARDIESGELAYKPILHTTVRPKKQLLRITAGKDTFEATGGHLFWVSGHGWTRARELKPGKILHGAGAPVTVLNVEDGIVTETYNLVVADFSNYFVGTEQILSHDNTPRRPTRVTVPGLEPK
jgi:hypothetical protein